jgi:hypothetical protein
MTYSSSSKKVGRFTVKPTRSKSKSPSKRNNRKSPSKRNNRKSPSKRSSSNMNNGTFKKRYEKLKLALKIKPIGKKIGKRTILYPEAPNYESLQILIDFLKNDQTQLNESDIYKLIITDIAKIIMNYKNIYQIKSKKDLLDHLDSLEIGDINPSYGNLYK